MVARLTRSRGWLSVYFVSLAMFVLVGTAACADRPVNTGGHTGWFRQEVHLRAGAGRQIRAIRYPDEQRGTELLRQMGRSGITSHVRQLSPSTSGGIAINAEPTAIVVNTIDSPPVAGFVPWVAIALTNSRADVLEINAVQQNTLTGSALQGNLSTNYAIGVFDTGASSSVISYADGVRAGIFGTPDYLTSSIVQLLGAGGGEAAAWVSQPIGVFVDGLSAINPSGQALNTSGVMGETNTSVIIGQYNPTYPDLTTAVGSPLSLYYAASIDNSNRTTVVREGEVYQGPSVKLYTLSNPAAPTYPSRIPLELRPTDPFGVKAVQYYPNLDLDPFDPDWGEPQYPTMVSGFLGPLQSLFFVSVVSMKMGSDEFSFTNNDGFLFDMGAQVTVVGPNVEAILGLDTNNPDFEVEIQDVTGLMFYAPGFYVNSVEIDAGGAVNRLSYTHVPVIRLDVMSPEGDFLEGIIGMNLFTEYNLVFRGGAFTTPPKVEFQALPNRLAADIAPAGGDGVVDMLDFAAFAEAFLAPVGSATWNWRCDLASPDDPDYQINLLDFAVLSDQWLATMTP
jgi:hypothetical protein